MDFEKLNAFLESGNVAGVANLESGFESVFGLKFSELDYLLIGAKEKTSIQNQSGFILLSSKDKMYAEKVLHNALKSQKNLAAEETQFMGEPFYILKNKEEEEINAQSAEASESEVSNILEVNTPEIKPFCITQISNSAVAIGDSIALRELFSTYIHDKMLPVTSSRGMMDVISDKSSLLFFSVSCEEFISSGLGQMLMYQEQLQGFDLQSVSGFTMDVNLIGTELQLSLRITTLTADSRQAILKRLKQSRESLEAATHGKIVSLDGGGNNIDLVMTWDEKSVRSISHKIAGVPQEITEDDIEEEVDLDGLIEEEESEAVR